MVAVIVGHRPEIEVESESPAVLVDEQALRAEVLIGVDDLIAVDGIGYALDRDVPTLLAVEPVPHVRIGLIGYEDLARCRRSLKPGGEVHAAADDGVVHPILAAEVADGAVPRVDSDPALEGFFDAPRPPYALQLMHPRSHGDGHLDTGERVLVDAARLGIAKEDDNSVADVLIDRRSVRERDLRHFGEIVVQ